MLDGWRVTEFDLAADAIVARDGTDSVVGYAEVRPQGWFAVVAPEHEGRGIGSRLHTWTEQREREIGRPQHRQIVAGTNARGASLLRGAG
jgi:GNAT superfamily N-acetyltransferase